MSVTLYDSIGDLTLSTGSGSLVGQNRAPNARYAPPVTGFSGDVQSGVLTAIRIETSSGATWEVCETVPVLSSGIFTYSRGNLLKSSTGARIAFAAGTKQIRFIAPAEAFGSVATNKRVSSAPISGDLGGVDFTLPFTPGTDSDGNPDVQLFLQGLLLSANDYSISGTSVTMNYAPIEGPFICSGNKA